MVQRLGSGHGNGGKGITQLLGGRMKKKRSKDKVFAEALTIILGKLNTTGSSVIWKLQEELGEIQ